MERRHLLASLGLGMVGLAGCSGGESPQQVDENTPTETTDQSEDTESSTTTETETETEPPEPREAEAVVGEIVEGERIGMVVRNVTRTKDLGEFQQADAGNTFVVVRLAVKNLTSNEFANFSGFLQTVLTDSEDYNYNAVINVEGQAFQNGQLAPGEVSRGDVTFEIPEDAPGLSLQFDFSAFSFTNLQQVIVDLERQASSIGDFTQSLQVQIYDIGDVVEFRDTRVVVNSVDFTRSIGGEYGASADDGMTFAVVDLSVTNGTDEEQNVSTLLQMGMKDGEGYNYTESLTATSQLDQAFAQGSPIPSGKTRRGKVAYSVPQSNGTLYWTFEFGIFADGDKTFWQIR